jgi:hypothetical protein
MPAVFAFDRFSVPALVWVRFPFGSGCEIDLTIESQYFKNFLFWVRLVISLLILSRKDSKRENTEGAEARGHSSVGPSVFRSSLFNGYVKERPHDNLVCRFLPERRRRWTKPRERPSRSSDTLAHESGFSSSSGRDSKAEIGKAESRGNLPALPRHRNGVGGKQKVAARPVRVLFRVSLPRLLRD